MDFTTLILESVDDIQQGIASRLKQRRLELNLSQKDFATRAGIGYDAYRRFEKLSDISLQNLLLCAKVVDDTEPFKELFTKKTYASLNDLLHVKKAATKKRASRK
jgi:transcriptional regulator with XRE-family HTH domain